MKLKWGRRVGVAGVVASKARMAFSTSSSNRLPAKDDVMDAACRNQGSGMVAAGRRGVTQFARTVGRTRRSKDS